MGLTTGAIVALDVGPVAHGGSCVARHDGQVVFVRHAIPGERVRARVTEVAGGGRYVRADAVEVVRASPDRVDPPCEYAGPGGCGGCDFQHVSLGAQRDLKADVVREQLSRLAGLDVPVVVEPVPGDNAGLRWRTRSEFAVDPQGRLGMHPHRSHDVIPVRDCLIASEAVIATGVLGERHPGCSAVDVIAPSLGPAVVLPLAGPDAGRSGQDTLRPDDVAPYGSGPDGPEPDGSGPDGPLRGGPDGRVSRGPDGVGSGAVVTEGVVSHHLTAGFTVAARGFWQVHPGAAGTFVDAVLDLLAPRAAETALDLYSGVGVFAAALAKAVTKNGLVIAVESDVGASRHGAANLAPWSNAVTVTARVDDFLGVARPARKGPGRRRTRRPAPRHPLAPPRVDLVVLDPPRTGAGSEVVGALARLQPRGIGYVACDPAALARDVAVFERLGYRLEALRAFDAFPMTHHVECVALLTTTGADLR